MLTVDTIPLHPPRRGEGEKGRRGESTISPCLPVSRSPCPSLGLFMISVFAATATELAKLKPIRRGLFILGRYVVAALTVDTLKHNIIAWHLLNSFPILRSQINLKSEISNFKSEILKLRLGCANRISDLKFEIGKSGEISGPKSSSIRFSPGL